MEALRCDRLTRAFRTKRAVDDVSLSLAAGDVYGLVGRNGAGKSTLLKLIAGYLAPTAGTVAVCGEILGPCQTSARLGCLIEHPAVNPGLTGFQNVMVRALAQGLANPKAEVAEVVEAVGLGLVADKSARGYSLGMKQRLGLALALVGRPDVLLLDEPFNGLDPEGVRQVRCLLADLALQWGCAVLISSHVLDQLERLVNRYGVLRDGRLAIQMTAEEVEDACADYLCVETPETPRALAVLEGAFPDAVFTVMPDDAIRVAGLDAEAVGRVLLTANVPVSGLYVHARDIEDYFVDLMGGAEVVDGPSRYSDTKGGGSHA
ncbi:ABC transporter ATP-binding protein [Adlercreutzia shanghongiae]|uniref:ABC transporter ATP-binding protein n=1 Tax=Adlercreutzia shanghongiae TaxID=3111773 RepID=A0ABU6J1L1_9ACTN|nr:ABC transporter ATP-binding protein [Adlercreutzia sp. R22]MEC4295964.1 ABC transporter ATP-binding protein [Adlercreutzia sp. R22]